MKTFLTLTLIGSFALGQVLFAATLEAERSSTGAVLVQDDPCKPLQEAKEAAEKALQSKTNEVSAIQAQLDALAAQYQDTEALWDSIIESAEAAVEEACSTGSVILCEAAQNRLQQAKDRKQAALDALDAQADTLADQLEEKLAELPELNQALKDACQALEDCQQGGGKSPSL